MPKTRTRDSGPETADRLSGQGPPAPSSQAGEPRLPGCLLAAGGLLLALILVEIGLRTFRLPLPDRFFEPNPTFGWFHIPDREGWQRTLEYQVHVQINQHGLRDDDHPYQKPAGEIRLLLLGDSFIEGLQVPHPETVGEQLEAMLNSQGDHTYQVIDSGVSRFGTDNELLFFQSEGLRYQPDIVILFFFYNDLYDNMDDPYFRLTDSGPQPVEPPPYHPLGRAERFRGWLWDHLQAYRLASVVGAMVVQLWSRPSGDAGELPFLLTASADRQRSLELTTALIERIRDLAAAHQAEFLVVGVSEREATIGSGRDAAARINRDLGTQLAALDIPYLDLMPVFRQRYLEDHIERFWPGDAHWNAAGHRLAAVEVLHALDQLHPSSPH
jgi:lysophospholipase L1-like esterase